MTKEQIKAAVSACIKTRLDAAGFSTFSICCNNMGSPCTLKNAEGTRGFSGVVNTLCVGDLFTVMILENCGSSTPGSFDVFVSESGAEIVKDNL